MAVYYRYRSGVDTFSLPVGDLKRLIHGTSRHGGHGRREGIAISDAQTGHHYTDDTAELVPGNSTVVMRRVPAEEDDDEVAKAISAAAELEWEAMTSIATEKQGRSSVASTTQSEPEITEIFRPRYCRYSPVYPLD